MTREEYLDGFFRIYDRVSVLSEKNGCLVFRARHKELRRDLVVHSLPESIPAYGFLLGIDCPHLPRIYDVIELDDGEIVLEEYLDGVTISQVLETGLYRYRGAAKVLAGVCAALTVLHENGLVHRDVKPDNVMITKEGRVVLIDFNASRRHSESETAKKDTVVMGTVGYAAPEQLGLAQTDARADVYAAGTLLNIMLTGRHPTEYIAKGRAGRIVHKCVAVNLDERYPSAARLAAAL